MLTFENVYLFVFVLPVYQLLYYTVQQLTFSRKQATRFYNGLLLLCMLFLLIINASLHLGGSGWVPTVMQMLFHPLLLGIFPLFFLSLYSRNEIKQSTPLVFRILLFAPPALFLLAGALFYGLFDGFQQQAPPLLSSCNHTIPGFSLNVRVLVYCFLFTLLLAVQAILVFARLHSALQSEWQHMRLDIRLMAWQKPLWVYGVFVSLLLFGFTLALGVLFLEMQNLVNMVIFNTLLLVTGGMLGLVSMRYRVLVLLDDADRENSAVEQTGGADVPPEAVEAEAAPDLLSEREARVLRKNLDTLMKDKKPYLKPSYSLDDLCGELKVDRRMMTWFMNCVLNKNFYTLINDYRIREAILYLRQDAGKYTIDAIAGMVGFRSKSSFYAGFKKHTGTTPHAYLKENSVR